MGFINTTGIHVLPVLSCKGKLFDHAGLYRERPSYHLSTKTFLASFEAIPDKGEITVPLLKRRNRFGEFITRDCLTQRTRIPFFRSLLSIVADAKEIHERNLEAGGQTPYPLGATNNQWAITHYEESEPKAEVKTPDHFEGLIILERNDGRHMELDLRQGHNNYLVGVGWSGRWGKAVQLLRVKKHNKVMSGGYYFKFYDQGLEGLREVLNLQTAPLHEVAHSLAVIILRSGQYEKSEMVEKTMLIYPDGESVDVHFIPAVAQDAAKKDTPPTLLIKGEPRDNEKDPPGGPYLEINLNHPHRRQYPLTLPLQPKLKEVLWDSAEKMKKYLG